MTDSINKVLTRINEIKSRFAPKRPGAVKTGKSFQEVLKNSTGLNTPPSDIGSRNISIPDIRKTAEEYAKTFNLPPRFVNAVIKTESNFNPNAVSPKGAKGLMQLMPAAISELGISNPFDINENIMGGVSILRKLLDKYNWDYRKALAAYNAGEAAVDETGGEPPYRETTDYIKKVINSYMENTE